MSQINTVGASLVAYLRNDLGIDDTVAAFLPDQQQGAERGDLLVLVDWIGGRLGDSEGVIALGGEIDLYTDRFSLDISRREGDLGALIDDMQRISFGLNYRWRPPARVSYKRVSERARQQTVDSNQQLVLTRAVELTLEVSYSEVGS